MAVSNHERVGKGLDLLKQGLYPFLEREMKAALGEGWQEKARKALLERTPGSSKTGAQGAASNWDAHALLSVLLDQWESVFRKTLGKAERTLANELKDVRNAWAHQKAFSSDDAYRALDSVERLLQAVSAPQVGELTKMKDEVLRVRFTEQLRVEQRKAPSSLVEGHPQAGLTPWREVVTPHRDVASGRYLQAEFAADLWQVYLGEAVAEYNDPVEFFRRTYATEGIAELLTNALQRLNGVGTDPVIELQTNFGGGKTHSMLALWHLFSGVSAASLSGLELILQRAGVQPPKGVKRAVLVGTRISPGQPSKKPDGTVVNTLWGELAWQLGEREGYEIVRRADETATNPGDALRTLLAKFTPCIILIDEWVAYARQLYTVNTLPAGTFDTHFTFAQTLSEAVKATPKALLVVSIPVSDNEQGGEGGRAALDRLKNAIGRVGAHWRPASAEEGFEIVRRRLFEPIVDREKHVARDAVAKAFAQLYQSHSGDFPQECREGAYEKRVQAAYPIHPEVFDRLYNDWSTLDRFQRTRGVLRLMASVIHSLWESQDKSLLILPSTIPIDDPAVRRELTHYLDDNWQPVIEQEVDGPDSLSLKLDREKSALGRYSACRRVARTIYMGSAPLVAAAHKGLDERHVKLGCAQPGETVATFGDALRGLSDKASFLYLDGTRFWFSTQPSVTSLAASRAEQLKNRDDLVVEEIHGRLAADAKTRGDFAKVVSHPESSSAVEDVRECRLVIISPEHPHVAKDPASAARTFAQQVLETRGNSPRHFKNSVVFLAADKTRLDELAQGVRQYLAWRSIVKEAEEGTLDILAAQKRSAETKLEAANKTVTLRIPETFQWLLVPSQDKPDSPLEWKELRLQGNDPLAVRAAKKLKNDSLLMQQMGGTLLRLDLDRIPLWQGNHVAVRDLADYYAKYLYLPRLRDTDVLIRAASDGVRLINWQQDSFGFAERYDEAQGRYLGLRAGPNNAPKDEAVADGLVVKPAITAEQLARGAGTAAGTSASGAAEAGVGSAAAAGVGTATATGAVASRKPAAPTRFFAKVALDPQRPARDASNIAQEVVQHLTGIVGAKVQVTLEVHAEIPEGVPENVVRTVTENCRTLKFKDFGFEQD